MSKRIAIAGLAAVVAATMAGTVQALVPTDPLAGHPTYAALNLPAAWDVTTGSPATVVAIVDSGVDPAHPDLASAVRPGHDFVDDDSNPGDPPGPHGTAVAGVAAARANNGIGGVGTCFSCDLMSLRVLGPDGIALNTDLAAAIEYAVDHGVAVVNASIYGPSSPDELHNAIWRAHAAGVLVVAAAGNEGSRAPQYPAAFPDTVAVGAATSSGTLTSYSGFGSWVDFAAPECAPVTPLGGTDGIGCATSVASPLVAGIVGLLRTNAPFATAYEIEDALASTAKPVPGTVHGLVDAAAALAALGRPAPRLQPEVLGLPAVGHPVEAFSGIWVGAGVDVRFQWERCKSSCAEIAGATSSRYTPRRADTGFFLRVTVAAPDLGLTAREGAAEVVAPPRALTRPTIAGRPRVGAVLVARRGEWFGGGLDYTVRWLRCRSSCRTVGTTHRYRVRPGDRGFRLRVSVRGSNAVGTATALSKPTRVVP